MERERGEKDNFFTLSERATMERKNLMATKKTSDAKRTQIKDLPVEETELTASEAGKVRGGIGYDIKQNKAEFCPTKNCTLGKGHSGKCNDQSPVNAI